MTTFWSLWVVVLTLSCLGLCAWVLFATQKVRKRDDAGDEANTTGHVYDGIEEYDNPLPKWWFQLFVGTMIFAGIYLALYPGLGNFGGFLKVKVGEESKPWTAVSQLESAQHKAATKFDEDFGELLAKPVSEIYQNEQVQQMGERLFKNNCAICHASDGGGAYGFPNLRDNDWLHGGSPEKIKETITHGRQANMPAWGDVIGEDGVQAVTQYVMSLSGLEHDAAQLAKGQEVFTSTCASCHGADAKGITMMGAPNLTDDIWLFGGLPDELQGRIEQTIRDGRDNRMPAQKELLKEEKIHLLTAYVYSLRFLGESAQ